MKVPTNFAKSTGDTGVLEKYYTKGLKTAVKGGSVEGLKLLKTVPKKPKNTKMSAYLKFGAVSVRVAYKKFPEELRRSLMWREFYYRMYLYTDFCYDKKGRQCKSDRWSPTVGKEFGGNKFIKSIYTKLVETGYITNRERMVLIHGLGVHWRVGEKMFIENLVDYDPLQNLGGWMWNFKPTNVMNVEIQEKKNEFFE